jgi:putative transcriptional regulator
MERSGGVKAREMGIVRLRLPNLRAERRLSQRQLAELAGLRTDTVSALERGDRSGIRFDTLARLCDVLNCQPGDMFEHQPDQHRVPVLGGPDEDRLVRQRLGERRIDGSSLLEEATGRRPSLEKHVRFAAKLRERLADTGRLSTDSVELIREDRAR